MSYGEDEGAKAVFWVVLAILMIVAIGGFSAHACSVADKASLGKLEQDVDTDNYKHSVAYREGVQRDFDELLESYSKAKTPDEKDVVYSLMKHRAQACPPEYIPQAVRELLHQHGAIIQ